MYLYEKKGSKGCVHVRPRTCVRGCERQACTEVGERAHAFLCVLPHDAYRRAR